MRSATIEERVRKHIEAERVQVPVSPVVASRILHALDAARPSRRRPRLAIAAAAAGIATVLLLGIAVAWLRTAQSPSGLVRGSWSTTGSMAVNRGDHTATLLADGRVLVVGGIQAIRPLASAELYDPSTRAWSSAG